MIFTADPSHLAQPSPGAFAAAAAAVDSLIGPDEPEPDGVCAALLAGGLAQVDGARWASITRCPRPGRFVTVAATDELARRADAIQYALGDGPCLRAVTGATVAVDEAGLRATWPQFAEHIVEATPIRSVLSRPLSSVPGFGSLNVYSDRPNGLEDSAMRISASLATACGLVLAAVQQRARADNLAVALESSRRIGAAIGVIMASRRLSYDEAFEVLRTASQHKQRKLRELADEVLYTGSVPA